MLSFPKDDDFFKNDNSLKSLIKTLESYIEIQFEMESVVHAICALKECSFKRQEISPIELGQEEAEMGTILNACKQLIDDYERSKNSIQIMRDDLYKIKDTLGIYTTLMFINPKLVLSLEMVFSGAIITYAKSFNSSQRRTVLNCKKVFGANKELIDFHNKIIELRNKHFAHSEHEYNRHILKYILTEEKNIDLDTSSHAHSEIWVNFNYYLFYKLVVEVKKYLTNEINEKATTIKSKLSSSQLKKLIAAKKNITM